MHRLPFAGLVVVLAGCGMQPAGTTGAQRSVEHFDANPADRAAVLKVCDRSPELYATDRNCFNADASRHKPNPGGGSGKGE